MENFTTEQTSKQNHSEVKEENIDIQIQSQENQDENIKELEETYIIDDHIKGVIEALLFVSEKPVTLDQIKKVIDTVNGAEIKTTIQVLKDSYEERKSGMSIFEIAGGYQMLSNSNYASYIRDFYKTKHKERLSKPALESLAIIAYKQPVTRTDIEVIRGVNSDGVVNHLLNKDIIKTVGRKEVPGRPFLYGTTKQFLEHFGLKSINDLPKLEEFPALLETEKVEEIEVEESVAKVEVIKEVQDIVQDAIVEPTQEIEEKMEENNNESE